MERFRESIKKLIIETSTNLPADVRRALRETLSLDQAESRTALALNTIAVNIDMARDGCGPICQDTGMPYFHVMAPAGLDQLALSEEIGEAVAEATREGALRPNSVDPITGKNTGDNVGPGTPIVAFEQWLSDDVEVRLILKGGGSENMSAQYSLPCTLPILGQADRSLEGVRKCILHAVHQAQGQGCSVGVLGVAVGGDRASGFECAKEQLFRELDDTNAQPALASLEKEIVQQANALGIGTMGFGGKVTLLGCKIGTLNRLPASFFVTVAYCCWAMRRLGVVLDSQTGAIRRWLYRDESGALRMTKQAGLPLTGREVRLRTPLSEGDVRGLRVGDVVLLSGTVHTGRDALHHYLGSHDSPVPLQGSAIYHCGPVALQKGDRWTMAAAGPTTSSREEPYQADVIRKFGIRAVIGKGGMGQKTLAALKEHGAVYLSAVGGAAQYYARCVEEVDGVDFLSFGVPEAMWHLRVKDFPVIVTMDSHGASLHDEVRAASATELAKLVEPQPA